MEEKQWQQEQQDKILWAQRKPRSFDLQKALYYIHQQLPSGFEMQADKDRNGLVLALQEEWSGMDPSNTGEEEEEDEDEGSLQKNWLSRVVMQVAW